MRIDGLVKEQSTILVGGNVRSCNQKFVICLTALLLAFIGANVVRGDLVSAANGKGNSPFVVLPYIQLGNNTKLGKTESLDVMWMSQDNGAKWSVEVASPQSGEREAEKPKVFAVKLRSVDHRELKPLFVLSSSITGLKPGFKFQYRVLCNGKQAFVATAQTRKLADQPFRFAVFGDIAAGTDAQKAIAFQCYKAKPDLVVIPGDIVYPFGRLSEYLEKFFPVYNSSYLSSGQGVPLLRSTLWVAAAGNHDIGLTGRNVTGDLNMFPDAFAYFLVWSQPLNGPLRSVSSQNIPTLKGSAQAKLTFMKAAGERYPRMANFSFDYGNSHWIVLDANFYMDWTDPQLRQWVEEDLLQAKHCRWKFVCFHQPGFSCDRVHSKEQRMRLLSDIFEKTGVDVVFCGHAHDYQRSHPLYFKVNRKDGRPVTNPDGTVNGDFSFDCNFDGQRNTIPRGVLYIVTGAGGAALRPRIPEDRQQFGKDFPWVKKFNNNTHSLTLCDVTDNMLKVSQVSKDGVVLDQFRITKDQSKVQSKNPF